MINFNSFSGIVTEIEDFYTSNEQVVGCYKIMKVQNNEGNIVNFVVEPSTYFVDQEMVEIGDMVVGYYDANAPVPYIYPPQYHAIVMVKATNDQNVKVDYFNNQLVSSDGLLKLNMTPFVPVLLENGQAFTASLTNRNLIVVYGPSTKSIPAQTIPHKIIVICR